MDLKVERIRRHVRLTDLARRMGKSRAMVTIYEGKEVVKDEVAAAYRRALDELTEENAA
jgi:transcriptional regulator with XRE-family HTH domain